MDEDQLSGILEIPDGVSRFEATMLHQAYSLADDMGASSEARTQIVRMIFLSVLKRVTNDIAKMNLVQKWAICHLYTEEDLELYEMYTRNTDDPLPIFEYL